MTSHNRLSADCDVPEPATSIVRPLRFRADIEGLRAIAILLVVAYHAEVPGFQGGYVGVDVFFVISGYLITWLLISELERKGKIDWLSFYARRAKRLLPALAAMLIVVSAIAALLYAPFEQIELARTALFTATYRSNLYFSRISLDYLNTGLDTNPLLHTWSLSVEEQFYFVWPLFFILATRSFRAKRSVVAMSDRSTDDLGSGSERALASPALNRTRILIWLVAASLLSFVCAVYLTATHQAAAFFLSFPRAWEFSVGAIALLIPIQLTKSTRSLLSLIGLAGLFVAVWSFDALTPFPGWTALLPAVATALILKANEPEAAKSLSSRLLSTRLLQQIGKFSYGWYLWHWPILIFASALHAPLTLWVRVGLVLGSLIPAIASYYAIENPVRRSKKLSRKVLYTLLLAIALTIGNAYLFSSWLQAAAAWSQQPNQIRYVEARNDHTAGYDNGCHVALLATDPNLDPHCIAGPPTSATTAVLFGDSHAAQWSDVMAEIAEERGWRFTAMTKSACPYIDSRTARSSLARPYAECNQWREKSLEAMRSLDPDWIFASTSAFAYDLSLEQWYQGTDRILAKLSAIAPRVVILRDTPSLDVEVPVCLARQNWQPLDALKSSCQTSVERDGDKAVYVAQVEAASQYRNVFFIDMLPYICEGQTCPVERDGIIVYRDDNHLSTSFTQTLADELLSEIDAVDSTQPPSTSASTNAATQ